jgi:hypothetical protein
VTIKYKSNDFKGSYKSPVNLDATDEIEQNIELAKGWNWISFSVKPDVMTTSVVFANADNNVTTVLGNDDSDQYDKDNNQWLWDMSLNNTEMYLVNASNDCSLNVTGHRVNPTNEPITMVEGWNWIAYNGQQVVSLGDALSGIDPNDGDIIKGQRGVAYYDVYEWIGSLRSLMPGNGYKYKNTSETDLVLRYPSSTAGIAGTRPDHDEEAAPTVFRPVDYYLYPANMVLIAQIVKDGMPVAGAELGIFATENAGGASTTTCREAVVTDAQGMAFITIPGDKATTLTFRVADGEKLYYASETVNYKTDDVIGSPRAPFAIELGGATGIERIVATGHVTTYDLQGRKIEQDAEGQKLRKGVYIVNGQKKVK